MTKVPPEKLASDISSLAQLQQACNETRQYEKWVKKSLQPVYDALDSYPECQDAYDALDKAEERLLMAYLIMSWAGENGLILSFTD